LPYLDTARNREHGGFDVRLEVAISSEQMRSAGIAPFVLSRNGLRHLYWTPAQLLTHHTSNGCNLRPGDLLATGTVSGPTRESRGCLLELAWRGTQPITLPTGETRSFLEDGDKVILRGWCEKEGWVRIGFGEGRGLISPKAAALGVSSCPETPRSAAACRPRRRPSPSSRPRTSTVPTDRPCPPCPPRCGGSGSTSSYPLRATSPGCGRRSRLGRCRRRRPTPRRGSRQSRATVTRSRRPVR